MNVFYNTKSNVTFNQISSYTYSLLFVNKNVSLGFIQLLCTHDFSRVSFAAELSTKLVYNSVFVKDYFISYENNDTDIKPVNISSDRRY